MNTYIGYTKKDGSIKVVEYLDDGSLDALGVTLNDYFKDSTDAKRIVKTTVDLIEEEEIQFEYIEWEDPINAFEEYDNLEDLIDSICCEDDMYYIYNKGWFVINKSMDIIPPCELDTALEQLR